MRAIPHYANEADLSRHKCFVAAMTILATVASALHTIAVGRGIIWTNKIPTAATDGFFIYVSPTFFMGLPNDSQRAFLIGHEVLHIVLQHMLRGKLFKDRGYFNHQLSWCHRTYNKAADYIINAMLVKMGLEMIPGGLLSDEFTAIARTVDGFFVDEPPSEDGQFCTYRQVEQSSDYLKQREATDRFVDTITPAIELGIASFIGIEAAAMFASFARQIAEGIPTAEEIFTNPLTSKVPSNPASQQFAVNRATAELHKYGPEAGNQLFDYVNRLARDLQVIAGVKAAKAAIRAGINLNSDLANAFMVKHADLIELATNIGE